MEREALILEILAVTLEVKEVPILVIRVTRFSRNRVVLEVLETSRVAVLGLKVVDLTVEVLVVALGSLVVLQMVAVEVMQALEIRVNSLHHYFQWSTVEVGIRGVGYPLCSYLSQIQVTQVIFQF